MKNIRWGIIGCGDVAEIKSGPAFSKIEGSSLDMVMRRDEKKLLAFAKRHKVKRCSTDYLDLLTDNKIDAIYIATPPSTHCFYTLEAAKYKKDVYVEKPMATTASDCKKMIDACAKNKVRLYVAYYRRGHDKFKTVKNIIETNGIGKIQSFNHIYTCKPPVYNPNRSWLLDKNIAGEGLLYDIGSHMIDIALFLFGDVACAQGIAHKQAQNTELSDVVSGTLEFKNQVQGCVQFSFNCNVQSDVFTINTEKGRLSFSVMSNDPITIITDANERIIAFDSIEHVQMPYIKEVIDDMNGAKNLDNKGMYGLKTQEILEAFSNNKSIVY